MLNSKTTFNFSDIEYIDSIIEEKYEIIDGQIYLMGGSRATHAFLMTDFSRLLGNSCKTAIGRLQNKKKQKK